MIQHKPFFSIVTVVKDDEDGLYATLSSVCAQSIASAELDIVVIDGGSLPEIDECVKTCAGKKNKHANTHTVRHLCGVDSGIYDAMNKGIANAHGLWILFLNTADVLCDETALVRIRDAMEHSDDFAQWKEDYAYVAADFYEDLRGHLIYKKVGSLHAMPRAMPTSHQALFIRNDIAMQYLFDTRYRVCADAHQMARVLKSGGKIFVCDECIATVHAQGYSTNNFARMMRERWRIQRELYPSMRDFLYMFCFVFTRYAKRYLRKIIPVKIQDALRTLKYKGTGTQHLRNKSAVKTYRKSQKSKKKKLLWLTTVLDESAVSKVFFLLAPHIQKKYDIIFVSIQPIESTRASQKLSDMHIPLVSLECKRLRVLRAARKLTHYIEETAPAIIHAHLGRAYIVACAACLRIKSTHKRPALLATFHNKFSYFSRITRVAMKHMLPHFHGVSAVSKDCLNSYSHLLRKKTCDRVQRIAIHNPVEYIRISDNPYDPTASAGQSPILFCALRLRAHKGNEHVIRMMKELCTSYYPHACVYLAGDGPLRKPLQTLVRCLKLEQHVHFLGHVETVYAYMKYADVVIFPSQSEGFGLVPCEAFLQETPVIMEDTSVARELFVSDVWYAPCNDRHALCVKVRDVVEHKKKYRTYVLREKHAIAQRFRPQSIAQKYVQWFDDVLCERSVQRT